MWQVVSCLLVRIKTEIQQSFQTQRKNEKTLLVIALLSQYFMCIYLYLNECLLRSFHARQLKSLGQFEAKEYIFFKFRFQFSMELIFD